MQSRDSQESSGLGSIETEHKFLLDQEPAPRNRRANSRLVYFWRVGVSILALGWVIPLLQSQQVQVSRSSNTWPTPHLSPLPREVFQTVKKTFYPDERYIGPSNETHRNWDHLVVAHDALYIEDPQTYGLPEGIAPPFDHPNKVGDGPHNFYVVSGLHQMHCLVSANSPSLNDLGL